MNELLYTGSKKLKDGTKKRKLGRNPRVPFTQHQVSLLEQKFRRTHYLSSIDVAELSSALNLTENRVTAHSILHRHCCIAISSRYTANFHFSVSSQGSVATYLECGGIIMNNLLSIFLFPAVKKL